MWQDQFKGRDFPFPDHPHNLQTKVNRSIWIWENGGVPIEGRDTYGRGLPGTQEDAQCAWVGMPPRLGPPSASRFDPPPKTKASWDQIQKSCPGSGLRVNVLGEWGFGGFGDGLSWGRVVEEVHFASCQSALLSFPPALMCCTFSPVLPTTVQRTIISGCNNRRMTGQMNGW